MPETQLGSMRLGSVDMPDEEEREGKTGVASLIHIADGQSDEILGDIAPEYIIDDTHRQSLEDTLETYEFYTFGDQPFTQHLKDRNRIIIPDEDGSLREFIIYESEKYRDTEGYKMYVIGTASYLDLKKANVIRPGSFTGTASQHIGIALNDTEWRPGIVEVSGSRTIHRDDFTNPFDYLKILAREFEGELRFRIEHNGNRITGRFVDLLERIGEWRGREIEFGKDLDGIRRIENTERIVTALIGLGPEREDGTRLEVFVDDTDALQRWGRPDPVTGELRHLIEVYEPESDRSEMTEEELRQYTRTELNKRINAVVTYECSVVDLENVPGMENKQIRFGDTIKIKDTKFNPPLYIEARVFEQERSIKSKAKKTIKLGDFVEYAEEDVRAIWRQLQEQIRKKISIADLRAYAEPKKIESDTPPPIREGENPIWVDTSGDIKVPHVAVGNKWVKMTPTTAEEVDAYTKQQTDEIAEDASRLKKGIIDVNQVPLRTSITGARIEWDGVNGLVQYNEDGEPVSWLDLDGNAYFLNGYFQGEIQADSGHFSGDITGATGTFGEVTAIDGDFFFQDANSQTKYGIITKTNLITDHSFELTVPTDNATPDGYSTSWDSDTWDKVGTPRLFSGYNTDTAVRMMFGYNYIGVNNSNYIRTSLFDFTLIAGKTYTFSSHFMRYTGSPTPKLRVKLMQYNEQTNTTSTLQTWEQTFPTLTDDSKTVRHSITFTLPSGFSDEQWVEFEILSGNSSWLYVDGVQLVEGNYPTIYEEESSLWMILNGLEKANYLEVRDLAIDGIVNISSFNTPLWTGALYPLDTHTIVPSKKITECLTGWVLEWSRYVPGDGAYNLQYSYSYVPKASIIRNPGASRSFQIPRDMNQSFWKYLYIYEDRIVGHANNNGQYSNGVVLRAVYEY